MKGVSEGLKLPLATRAVQDPFTKAVTDTSGSKPDYIYICLVEK